jgi:DNA-directed RNA polymerase subunit RPC12/RpoP
MKKREFKTPQHKLCSELYLDGKIWALNEVLDPSCVTIQNLDMNTYNCALCGRQITKEDYETDLSFCEECNEATLNKDKD